MNSELKILISGDSCEDCMREWSPVFRIAAQGRRPTKACHPPVTWARAGWGGHSDETAQKPTGNFDTETDSSGEGSNQTSRKKNF